MVVFISYTFSKNPHNTFNDITDQQGQSAYILVKATLQPSKF